MGVEYDFGDRVSRPSSIKLVNETTEPAHVVHILPSIPLRTIMPGTNLTVKCNVKRLGSASAVIVIRIVSPTAGRYFYLGVPIEALEWTEITHLETPIPEDATALAVRLSAEGVNGDITWFDDFEVYQNGVLIYKNPFSNWTPTLVGLGGLAVITKLLGIW